MSIEKPLTPGEEHELRGALQSPLRSLVSEEPAITAAHEEADLVNEQVDVEKGRNPEQPYQNVFDEGGNITTPGISDKVIARPEFQPKTDATVRAEEALRESNSGLYEALKRNDFKRAIEIAYTSGEETSAYRSVLDAQLESVFSSGNIEGIKSAFEVFRPSIEPPYTSYVDDRLLLEIPSALRKEKFVQDQIRERVHEELRFPTSLKNMLDFYRQSGLIDDAFIQDPALRMDAKRELMYQLSHYYRSEPLKAAKYIDECAATGLLPSADEIKRDPQVRGHFEERVEGWLIYGDVINGVGAFRQNPEKARAFVEAVVATGIVDPVPELRKRFPVIDEVYKVDMKV